MLTSDKWTFSFSGSSAVPSDTFTADGMTVAGSNYVAGTGPIHWTDFKCAGDETDLASCSHSNETTLCSHSEDAGVVCLPGIYVLVTW